MITLASVMHVVQAVSLCGLCVRDVYCNLQCESILMRMRVRRHECHVDRMLYCAVMDVLDVTVFSS